MRSGLWFAAALLVLGAPCLAQAAACALGPPEPKDPRNSLRPTSTAACAYDLDDFHRRLDRLATIPGGGLGVETVEALFGLPPLTTLYDEPRSNAYYARLDGDGGWSAYIALNEAFDGEGPARFAGALRPRRLPPNQRGEIRLEVLIVRPNPFTPGPDGCRSAADFVRVLRRAGWREDPVTPFATDGVVPAAGFVRAGGLGLDLRGVAHAGSRYTPAELRAACLGDFAMVQQARALGGGGGRTGKVARSRSPH